MKMIIEPDGIEAQALGFLSGTGHGFVLLDRVGNADKVQPPTLGHNDAEFDSHARSPVWSITGDLSF
jgi:hypothetical protein